MSQKKGTKKAEGGDAGAKKAPAGQKPSKGAKADVKREKPAPAEGGQKAKPMSAITVKKSEDFSDYFTQLVEKAELADIRYGVKGFVCYMPWAVMTIKKMYAKYEQLLEANGHLPLIMPTVIPKSFFEKESDHVKGFAPEVFWVTEAGGNHEKLEEPLALRPTSETALYSMYSMWIRSYQDLPFKRYQSCQVFRYEGRSTRPFFRAREFHWIEAHDVFATLEDARNQVLQDMDMSYKMVRDEFCIPIIFFQRPEWDKFAGAIHTYAADALLESGKVIQLPSTHLLGQNFSGPFNVRYVTKDGKDELGYITCYGPAISRIYGAMVAVLGDDQGLVLPWDLAPVQVVIVPIYFKGQAEAVDKACKEVEAEVKAKLDAAVKVDDRDYITAGEKFNEWEMRGVPVRIEIGPKDVEKGQVVVVTRVPRKKEFVPRAGLAGALEGIAKSYTQNLRDLHLLKFDSLVQRCDYIEDAKEAIDGNKIACVGLCSIDMSGYSCAEKVEKGTGGVIRGRRVDDEPNKFDRCVACGAPNPVAVYVARSY
ncbi:MAG: proline--tRNA ligase [Candidatus Lokiarchaeota archaeon]|nr:proline--tRNA ligase [Candidatus Lokiarchaeota archaeon]